MKSELTELRDRLQQERQEIATRLKEIDGDLASIERVFSLVQKQPPKDNRSQQRFIRLTPDSTRFTDFTFNNAVLELFQENPSKFWAPKEIVSALLKEGFTSGSKDFAATARTMLGIMRKKNKISATKIKSGWLYGPKKDSTPHMAEVESNVDTGGLGERSKPVVL